MNFIEPEGFDAGTISDEIPGVVSAYVTPEEIPDDILEFVVSIDGALYDFPCPITEFINNGWEIVADKSVDYVEANGIGGLTLRKNNQETRIIGINKASQATAIQYCFVDIWEDGSMGFEVPMELSGGIRYGDTLTEVRNKLDDLGVTYEYENEELKVVDDESLYSKVVFNLDGETMKSLRCVTE